MCTPLVDGSFDGRWGGPARLVEQDGGLVVGHHVPGSRLCGFIIWLGAFVGPENLKRRPSETPTRRVKSFALALNLHSTWSRAKYVQKPKGHWFLNVPIGLNSRACGSGLGWKPARTSPLEKRDRNETKTRSLRPARIRVGPQKVQ